MSDLFPEVGDWVTIGYSRSTICWGRIKETSTIGVQVTARSIGTISVPAASPSRHLFIPWSSIDYIQGAEGGAQE